MLCCVAIIPSVSSRINNLFAHILQDYTLIKDTPFSLQPQITVDTFFEVRHITVAGDTLLFCEKE